MVSAVFGPLPVEEGIERCREFLDTAATIPAIRATAPSSARVLEAMRGEFDAARELLAEGRGRSRSSG